MRSKQTKQGLLEGRESKSILKKDKRAAMSATAAGRGKGSGPCYHQLIKQEVQACIHHHICHGNQMYYSNVREDKMPWQAWQGAAADVGSPQGARCTKAERSQRASVPGCLTHGVASWNSGGRMELGGGEETLLKLNTWPPPQGLCLLASQNESHCRKDSGGESAGGRQDGNQLDWAYNANVGFPGGKECACQCRRHGFDPWVGKIPWRRKWQCTPLFLPGKSHG